jgi:hypothetical protein
MLELAAVAIGSTALVATVVSIPEVAEVAGCTTIEITPAVTAVRVLWLYVI